MHYVHRQAGCCILAIKTAYTTGEAGWVEFRFLGYFYFTIDHIPGKENAAVADPLTRQTSVYPELIE